VTEKILFTAALLCIAIVSAKFWLASDVWHLCPRCWHWVNRFGEKVKSASLAGVRISTETKICAECAKQAK
jgi:hypothetical protein